MTTHVLALGDSLTTGHGLGPAESFAARLQALLRDDRPGTVVHDAGVSGDTTADALRRLPRVLASLPVRPDLALVELGPNDLWRGVPPAATRANLDAILLELARCGMPVLLATFDPPPFLVHSHGGIHREVAARHGARTHPFFPPGVLGHPDLVLADRVHPNARAVERIARAWLPVVAAALDAARAEAA